MVIFEKLLFILFSFLKSLLFIYKELSIDKVDGPQPTYFFIVIELIQSETQTKSSQLVQ